MKWFRDIIIEYLSWLEFKRHSREKYLSGRYYNSKSKELYELKMGSMTDKEHTTKFLELLRYVLYL